MGQVSWSWEADVKAGKLARFKKDVVVPWNIFAAADPDTLISRWAVDESLASVKVYQLFTSAKAAFGQFAVNDCWGKLDEYLEPTEWGSLIETPIPACMAVLVLARFISYIRLLTKVIARSN